MLFCFAGAEKNRMNATYLENEKWAASCFLNAHSYIWNWRVKYKAIKSNEKRATNFILVAKMGVNTKKKSTFCRQELLRFFLLGAVKISAIVMMINYKMKTKCPQYNYSHDIACCLPEISQVHFDFLGCVSSKTGMHFSEY